MTGEEYRAAVRDVVYLAACAVNGRTPDSTRVARMELPLVYEAADHHLLTGITAIALAGAGVQDDAFTQARGKAIRKVAAFDVERAAILAQLEQAGIWYMPLKGCILKELYPQLGMRQMADNDILYDASRRADVRSIMEGLGFNTEEIKHQSVHDHYFKPPVCNFEMHRKLFGANQGKLAVYYRDVKTRLLRTEGTEYGFHFRSDDFYVYMTAHEYKHYSGGGTGLRSLLDTYVYIGKKGAELDWDYIGGELEKLGIAGFEAQNRSLARHLFAGEALTAADEEMLNYILSSGTYGTVWNRVNNNLSAFG
ncbi:MAG: nucleotidyltransferase family protein, partial [Firmicutes bacterium]|nr:nucleotidyltransferase family protein [Bacillota bacterium]